MSNAAGSKTLSDWIAVTCGTITAAVGIGTLTLWTLAQRQLCGLDVNNMPVARKAGLLFALLEAIPKPDTC